MIQGFFELLLLASSGQHLFPDLSKFLFGKVIKISSNERRKTLETGVKASFEKEAYFDFVFILFVFIFYNISLSLFLPASFASYLPRGDFTPKTTQN
jgi:hypothetical protein